jgi:sugar/nucleoside kinase (ribokinase family)
VINIELDDDGRRLVLGVDGYAGLVAETIATEFLMDPGGIAAGLIEITRRRRAHELAVTLAAAHALPGCVVTETAAALEEIREAFVACLSGQVVLTLNEEEARRLAVALSRGASRAAAGRMRRKETP